MTAHHLITLDQLRNPRLERDDRLEAGPLNLGELERKTVVAALQQCGGNKVHASKALGISRRALYRQIEKYQLESDAAGGASLPITSK